MFIFLIILLVIASVSAIPVWPHSRKWGYFPSTGLGLLLAVFLILIATGRV